MCGALEPGATAFDVGANVGVYAVTAALRVGATGRVIAVEADEEYLPRLQGHRCATGSRTSRSLPRLQDSDGEVELIIAADRAFSSIQPLVCGRRLGRDARIRSGDSTRSGPMRASPPSRS